MGNWDWYKQWEKTTLHKRGDEYEELKKSLGQRMIDKCCELFPQVRSAFPNTVPAGFSDHPPSEGLRSLNPARPLKLESGYSDRVAAKARVWV